MNTVRPASPPRPPHIPWYLRSKLRLLAALLVGLVVPFGAFSVGIVHRARTTLEKQAIESNSAAAKLAADVVDAHFDGLARYLESCARRADLGAAVLAEDAQAVRAQLEEFVRNHRELNRVFVADTRGIELYDWPPDPDVIGKSFAHRDWFRNVQTSGRAYVSEIYVRAAAPPCDVVAIAVALGPVGDAPLGYLVAQYRIEDLVRRLSRIRTSEAGSITLLDQHDHLAVRREDFSTPPHRLDADALIQEIRRADQVSRFADDPVNGVPSLLSSARVPRIGWLVVAQLPVRAVFAPAEAFVTSFVLASILCLAVMLALGFSWSNALRRHHVALLELQKHKDLLSGMVFHDLRNPLAATLGSIDLIRARSSDLDPALREDVARAAHSAQRMRDLLNNLLDIMRMEDGALEAHVVRRDLGALVRARADEFRPLALAGGVRLRIELPAEPVEVDLDPDLIGRVLDNLITNALRHTPSGGQVEIRVGREGRAERALLTVADTGEGIPTDALPLLFQKYAAIPGQERRRLHDVGLGLVFCRMAVELHGGTIEVGSQIGRGSVFRILFPSTASRT